MRAAQGDAGRGRCSRRPRGWRGTPARGGGLHEPVLRLGHDRHRGGADRLRHRPRALRRFACERLLPFSERRDARRDAAPAQPCQGAGAKARKCRSSPATCRFAWSTSPGGNAERAGVAHAIQFNGGDALERPARPAAELPGR
jgi:putative N6-adenine-specific DNA methylase